MLGVCLKRCIFTTLLPFLFLPCFFFLLFYCGIRQTYFFLFRKRNAQQQHCIYISHIFFFVTNRYTGNLICLYGITVLLYYITYS
ncbi:hypothetical protein BZA77DRAFT_19500 [Pyronema omphalodes]|nr:hypothetical protein BZA77DRAFT_19500 [Pyronema omphalodes]